MWEFITLLSLARMMNGQMMKMGLQEMGTHSLQQACHRGQIQMPMQQVFANLEVNVSEQHNFSVSSSKIAYSALKLVVENDEKIKPLVK